MHGLPDKHNCFPVCTHNRPCLEVEKPDHVNQGEPTILLLSPMPWHLRFERQGTWDKKNNYHRKFQQYSFIDPLANGFSKMHEGSKCMKGRVSTSDVPAIVTFSICQELR